MGYFPSRTLWASASPDPPHHSARETPRTAHLFVPPPLRHHPKQSRTRNIRDCYFNEARASCLRSAPMSQNCDTSDLARCFACIRTPLPSCSSQTPERPLLAKKNPQLLYQGSTNWGFFSATRAGPCFGADLISESWHVQPRRILTAQAVKPEWRK